MSAGGCFVVEATRPDGHQPEIRVAVAMPCYGGMPAGTTFDYGNLLVWTMAELVMPGVLEIVTMVNDQTYVEENREQLVAWAFEKRCTHILWLDSDMRFPMDSLHQLLLRSNECALVGANYRARRAPYHPTAFRRIGPDEVYCVTEEESTGTEEVASCGMGVMLTSMEVFERLDAPYFTPQFRTGHRTRDDVAFCMRARETGFRVYVDHDLSKQVRHVGVSEVATVGVAEPGPLIVRP